MNKHPRLVKYLQFSLAIGDTNDPTLNSLTEDELELVLEKCATQMDLSYPFIPNEEESILICLAKKEIYWRMATVSAPLYQLDLEGLKVSKQVRFDHYIALIKQVDDEYKALINDPKRVSVTQGDIMIRKPYTFSKYITNYNIPTINMQVDKATSSTLEISILYNDLIGKDFSEANVYIHTQPIWDKYESVLNKDAVKKLTLKTFKTPYFRLKDLDSNTKYYVLLEVVLLNGNVKTYTEIEGDTSV